MFVVPTIILSLTTSACINCFLCESAIALAWDCTSALCRSSGCSPRNCLLGPQGQADSCSTKTHAAMKRKWRQSLLPSARSVTPARISASSTRMLRRLHFPRQREVQASVGSAQISTRSFTCGLCRLVGRHVPAMTRRDRLNEVPDNCLCDLPCLGHAK